MRKVEVPIRLTVMRKAPLRPRRSPMTPKISAPSGRNAKPAANKPSAAMSAGVGSSPAKKTLEMTGARLPKMKKSYHSKAVPADDAMTTRAIDERCCSGRCAIVAIVPPRGGDSSARRSVQLADCLVEVGDGDTETGDLDLVADFSVTDGLQQLV